MSDFESMADQANQAPADAGGSSSSSSELAGMARQANQAPAATGGSSATSPEVAGLAAVTRAQAIAGAAYANLTSAITGTSFRFDVNIGALDLGAWSKCDGLQVDYQVSTYQTAMNPDETNIASPRLWNYLSRPTYKSITLARPVTAMGMHQTAAWLKAMWYSPIPEYGRITLYSASHIPIHQWGLLGVVPEKWSGPNLDIDGGKVGIETLVLAHEGWDWSL